MDESGQALGLEPEAGFFELAGEDYISEGKQRQSPRHRVWYSFFPADDSPADRPLCVLFNGGPGSSTAILFGFNTGPFTLDPGKTGDATLSVNPHSMTSFANLLYVDAPSTGFSYALPTLQGDRPNIGIDLDRDAASVLRVVLRFLDRHPALTRTPVILVGESYGGTRATLMLQHFFEFERLVDDGSAYQDASLYQDIVEHLQMVFPAKELDQLSAQDLQQQFGHQALIQAVVGAGAQWERNEPDTTGCLGDHDPYQCDQPAGWFEERYFTVASRLLELDVLRQALGVDPTSIAWLHAKARIGAYGRVGPPVPDDEFVAVFGSLAAGDSYYLPRNLDVSEGYDLESRWWTDPSLGVQFLKNLRHVRTLLSNAQKDVFVWAESTLPGLASYFQYVSEVRHNRLEQPGVPRTGWIEIDLLEPVETAYVRFPRYEAGGHAITMQSPGEFLQDLRAFYEGDLQAPAPTSVEMARYRAEPAPTAPSSPAQPSSARSMQQARPARIQLGP